MPYTPAKYATDKNGGLIQVGDNVDIISIYTNEIINRGLEVSGIHRQGANGTILHFNTAPNPEYPHHLTHKAKLTIKN